MNESRRKMDDTATDAARLVELAHLPWDQQSYKVKSELSKLRTGRSDEYARALIAAHERIKELEAKQAWQPIETAPRDGSVIDVWLGDADRPSIHFYCGDGTKRAPSWHFKDGKFRPVLGGLRMPVFVEPTHWMPLPEPPK